MSEQKIIVPMGAKTAGKIHRKNKTIYYKQKDGSIKPLTADAVYRFCFHYSQNHTKHFPLQRLPCERNNRPFDIHFMRPHPEKDANMIQVHQPHAVEFSIGNLNACFDDCEEKLSEHPDPMIVYPCTFKSDFFVIVVKNRWEERFDPEYKRSTMKHF